MAIKVTLPKNTNEKLAALKAKVLSKAIQHAARVLRNHVDGQTDAGRMIAALPPIRFHANRAGQLGNRCVRELERQ